MQSTELPIKALPFALRPSTVPTSKAPVAALKATTSHGNAVPPVVVIDLTTTPDSDSPVAEATTTAPAQGSHFHDYLASLPPVAPITLSLEGPCPRRPSHARRPLKLNLKPSSSSLQPKPAKRIITSPRPQVEHYVHKVHTESTFCPEHYARAVGARPAHRTARATAPLTVADLDARYAPGPSCYPMPAYHTLHTYRSEERDYASRTARGYLHLADLDAQSSDEAEEAEVEDSLTGSEFEDDFAPELNHHAPEAGSQMSAAAVVAGGAGYLAGCAVRAAIVAANSIAGWCSRRNTTRR